MASVLDKKKIDRITKFSESGAADFAVEFELDGGEIVSMGRRGDRATARYFGVARSVDLLRDERILLGKMVHDFLQERLLACQYAESALKQMSGLP